MKITRTIFSWLSLHLVGTGILLTANSFALFMIITADNIKATLAEEKTYQKITPAVLDTAAYPTNEAGQLPLKEPWVQDVFNKAFPANDLENQGNTAIDSSFAWLEGRTDKPEFTLDFADNKQALGTEVGNYATSRLTGLPTCSLKDLPDTLDVFKVNCSPPGLNTKRAGDNISQQIASDPTFLPNPVITSDAIPSGITGNQTVQNPLTKFGDIRVLFKNRTAILWGLPIATLLLGAAGLALATNRGTALKRLGRILFSSAIGLLLFGLIIGFLLDQALKLTAKDAISREVLGPVITNLTGQFQQVYIVAAVICFALCAVVFVAYRKLFGQKSKSRIIT